MKEKIVKTVNLKMLFFTAATLHLYPTDGMSHQNVFAQETEKECSNCESCDQTPCCYWDWYNRDWGENDTESDHDDMGTIPNHDESKD